MGKQQETEETHVTVTDADEHSEFNVGAWIGTGIGTVIGWVINIIWYVFLAGFVIALYKSCIK